MDYKKLISTVKLCGSTPKVNQCKKCTYWSGGDMSKCIPRMTTDVATTLSTLQAKNENLWAELERMKEIMRYNGIMVIPSKYTCGRSEWNIPKPRGQKEN